MDCLDDDRILALLEGRLSAGEERSVEAHLDACGRCRRLLSQVVRTIPDESLADLVPYPTEPSPEAKAEPLRPGAMVDSFQVSRFIGRGGMGEVYLARDLKLGRRVALKLVRPDALGSPAAVRRFLFEARVTARFNHPHIVAIHAAGELRGRPYLALEYVEGENLRQRLDRERPTGAEALRIGLAMASALHEAHEHGILHRDLKPANVLIASDGRVRVLDFGLAATFLPRRGDERGVPDGAAPAQETTTEGVIRGTPRYMAPEQWTGAGITGAADIWALGMVLFEMLEGRLPYGEVPPAELPSRVPAQEPVPGLDGMTGEPAGIGPLVAACLEKDPGLRPTAGEVTRRLSGMLAPTVDRADGRLAPFRGLLPFDARHSHLFFGRDAEIAAFVERLRHEPLLPVVGPSGSGKSSFVLAGVVPRLRERGPLTLVQMRPGPRPLVTLAHRVVAARCASSDSPFGDVEAPEAAPLVDALLETPELLGVELQKLAEQRRSSVLLLVDQLEEVFLVPDGEARRSFLRAVTSAADDAELPVRVIFTLREEFLGRVAGSAAPGALGRIVVISTPGPAALLEAIVRPVEAVGFAFDDARLPAEMAEAVAAEAACLPLLQFAGQLLWERRDRTRRLLLRSAYEETGGVVGALARHADGVISGMTAGEVRLARALFLRLVTPGGTRRALPREQLQEALPGDVSSVVTRLVEARLLTARQADDAGEATIELAHEALVTAWDRLRRWIEESREELVFLAEVGQAADLWHRRGRQDEEVWHGPALEEALRMLERCTAVPDRVSAFIGASKRKRDRRSRRRRVALVLGVALLSLVALVLALLYREARQQRRRAEGHRERAEERRAEAQLEGARAAFRRRDLLEARAQLRGALETRDTVLARVLWRQLGASPELWKLPLPSLVVDVAFSGDGRLVAASTTDGLVYLVDSRTRRVRRILRGHRDQVFPVAFSPDGRTVASASQDGEVRLWETATGRGRSVLGRHRGIVYDLRHTGALVVSGSEDRTVRLWDAGTGRALGVLRGHTAAVFGVAVSPDGRLIASGSEDRTARIWDRATRRELRRLDGHTDAVRALGFSPDGATLATASQDRTVRLWAIRSGVEQARLTGHADRVYGLSFSRDGRLLATTGADRTVRIWSVGARKEIRRLEGHREPVWGVAFGPSGRLLATGGHDRTVRLWDLSAGSPGVRPPQGHEDAVIGVDLSPDGRLLATAGLDRTTRLWDVETGEQIRVLRGHQGAVLGACFSPDGARLATSGHDRTVRLWDPSTGHEVRTLSGHGGPIWSLRFSNDGRRLATGATDGTARVWEVKSGRELRLLRHGSPVWDVAFSPDGKTLATCGADGRLILWEAARGRILRERKHPSPLWGVSYHPAGGWLAYGGADGQIVRWDLVADTTTTVARQPGRVYRLQVHPGGEMIGSPGSDGVARLWGIDGEPPRVLRGHRGEVNVVRFSRDGRLAATTSDDGTARVWEVESGRPLWRTPLLVGSGGRVRLFSHRGWYGTPPGAAGWQRAVERRAALATVAPDGGPGCLVTFDGKLELWRMASGGGVLRRDTLCAEGERARKEGTNPRRAPERSDPLGCATKRLLSSPGGCVTLAGGVVRLHSPTGPRTLVARDAVAVSVEQEAILVATTSQLLALGRSGARRRTFTVPPGVTAVGRAGRWIVVGYREGNMDLLDARTGRPRRGFLFERVPSSQAERIAAGPRGTLVAGYANGLVGLWDLQRGTRLDTRKLHGPVSHLVHDGQKLHVASELGGHLVWDLAALHLDYCELLRDVWRRVPVAWRDGLPVLAPAPTGHRCRRGSAR